MSTTTAGTQHPRASFDPPKERGRESAVEARGGLAALATELREPAVVFGTSLS